MEKFDLHKSQGKIDVQKFFDLFEPSTYQAIMLALRFRMEHCMKQMKEAEHWGFTDAYNYWLNELNDAINAYNFLP